MIDLLIKEIERKRNPSVIGLDPTLELLPKEIIEENLEAYEDPLEAVGESFWRFNREIIDSTQSVVPAVKLQIAMYEQYGIEGLKAYIKTINYAKEKGLVVIGDIKRGDIASTAEAYSGHLGGVKVGGKTLDPWKEDWITVNPYFGTDGIKPFVEKCKETQKGIFVLVKTSNPSGKEIQDLRVGTHKVYEMVAKYVCEWGKEVIGASGYSRVAAVVGATHKEEGNTLREMMPGVFFLVPGYGAQGGTGEFVRGFFDGEKRGVLVNSSRGIIGACKGNSRFRWDQFGEAALEAAKSMRNDLREVIE